MQTKLCKGPLHPPGGSNIPITDFTVNKTGPRIGKPLSRCKYCRSLGNSKTVPSSIFMPLLEELQEGKTVKELSAIVELKPDHVRALLEGKRKRIYRKTYFNIKKAISELPRDKISIGPQSKKTTRDTDQKLDYEARIGLKKLISEQQKRRYKTDKKLLRHVV